VHEFTYTRQIVRDLIHLKSNDFSFLKVQKVLRASIKEENAMNKMEWIERLEIDREKSMKETQLSKFQVGYFISLSKIHLL
jgi:hypothetical protein